MMKVIFVLFRYFDCIVPIRELVFRWKYYAKRLRRLGINRRVILYEFGKREFRILLRNFLALQSKRVYNKVDICSRRSNDMAISYNKLWKLLVDKKMSKADLRKAAGIAPNTMTRLRRDEEVTLAVLNKICKTLEVDIGDIMEFLPDVEDEVGKK